jgi:hypothetical protein
MGAMVAHVQRIRLLLLQAQLARCDLRGAGRQGLHRQARVAGQELQHARQAAAALPCTGGQPRMIAGPPQAERLVGEVLGRHFLRAEVRQPLEGNRQRQYRQGADHEHARAALGQLRSEVQFLGAGGGQRQTAQGKRKRGASGHGLPFGRGLDVPDFQLM